MMVYNGTGCGLNTIIWAPHFDLPTVKHTTHPGCSQCDLDIMGMFLNLLFNKTLEQMSGVDMTYVRSNDISNAEWEKERASNWELWHRS